MKIVFMGTPEFARIILHELACANCHDIIAVFTGEDSVSKRGNKLIPTPVKVEAEKHSIPVYTPKTLKNEGVITKIKSLCPDVICVAAYGRILPKAVLEIPKHGCLNVHASLLPRWRGAAPIERAILAGDEVQGVSIMRMEEGLDTGDFSSQVEIEAIGKTAPQITDELAHSGAKALIKVLNSSDIQWTPQNEMAVTYANKIEKNELNLDEQATANDNCNRVLASADSHPAKCVIAEKTVRVTCGKVSDIEVQMSKVAVYNKELLLGCSNGTFEVLRLKPDGKKEMDATSFIAGNANVREGNACWGRV